MRIALTHNLPSGGARRHTMEQVRELVRRGNEIVEFVPSSADIDYCSCAPFVSRRVIYPSFPSRQAKHIPFLSPYIHAVQGLVTLREIDRVNRRIAGEIDAEHFDAVLVKDCQLAMNPYALRYLRTPSVFQCHHGLRHRLTPEHAKTARRSSGLSDKAKSVYYLPANQLFEFVFRHEERENARSAARVLTNSDFSRCLLAKHYGTEAGVIYPGINTSVFRPLSLDRLEYVLSVGALIYGKGYRFLVSALGKLDPDRRPPLFIAANSVEPDEETVVREMAARANVEIHIEQIVDDDHLVEVYNRARAFVYAPIQEALGMAPLEAMACGTPVVAVGEGGVRETVRNGETGYLVERNSEKFAEKLTEFLADDQTRRRMGQAGIEVVRRDWTWTRAVDRLERELTNVRTDRTVDRRY